MELRFPRVIIYIVELFSWFMNLLNYDNLSSYPFDCYEKCRMFSVAKTFINVRNLFRLLYPLNEYHFNGRTFEKCKNYLSTLTVIINRCILQWEQRPDGNGHSQKTPSATSTESPLEFLLDFIVEIINYILCFVSRRKKIWTFRFIQMKYQKLGAEPSVWLVLWYTFNRSPDLECGAH